LNGLLKQIFPESENINELESDTLEPTLVAFAAFGKVGSERPDAYAALLNCLQNPKRTPQTVLGFNVSTVLMYGFGGRN